MASIRSFEVRGFTPRRHAQGARAALAVNYEELSENLSRFYDFTDKVVVYVGAAGRQLLDPKVKTRNVVAIDRDVEALRRLESTAGGKGARPLPQIVGSAFESVSVTGDVVYFE